MIFDANHLYFTPLTKTPVLTLQLDMLLGNTYLHLFWIFPHIFVQ